MNKLVIIGGHGNGTVISSTVEDINTVKPTWEIIGFINDGDCEDINGYRVLGCIEQNVIDELLCDPEIYFYWSLISVKFNHKFIHNLERLNIPLERFATIVHPMAVVSSTASLGSGVSVQPFVNIGPNVKIGNHIHIFAQAMIGHGAVLDDYSYVANNACVGANVKMKKGAYIGTNATTIENICLGEWSLTGIGSVVIRNVEDYCTVVGNPASVIKSKY